MTGSHRRVRLGAVVAAFLAAAALAGPASASPSLGPTPPPLPPQPAPGPVPAHLTCALSAQVPNTWATVMQQTNSGSFPAVRLSVDPAQPCLQYRATDNQSLERSTDGGVSWHPAFHDDQHGWFTDPALGTKLSDAGPFEGSGVLIPRPGALLLSERGNGDAVLASDDAAATWRLSNLGIGGQDVERLVASPSNPAVIYAVRTPRAHTVGADGTVGTPSLSAAASTVAVSGDGGATWKDGGPVPPPTGSRVSGAAVAPWLQVDPSNPSHLWLVNATAVQGGANGLDVYESSDGAATWNRVGGFPIQATLATSQFLTVMQFLAVRLPSQHGAVRLFLTGQFPDGSTVQVSDDGGATWRSANVPVSANDGGITGLAADPRDPDRMLLASSSGGQPAVLFSTDGFDSHRMVHPPRQHGGPPGNAPWTAAEEVPGDLAVQADRLGGFSISLAYPCASEAPGAPGCPDKTSFGVTVYRFVPPMPASSGPGGNSGGGALSPAPIPVARVQTCLGAALSGSSVQAMAYDGQSLIVSYINEPGPAPGAALLHLVDPKTCTQQGTVIVQFDAADLRALAARGAYQKGTTPQVLGLAYDRTRGGLWIGLGSTQAALFLASLAAVPDLSRTSSAVPYRIDAHLRISGNGGCIPLLSHDSSDDTLWTCADSSQAFHAADGTPAGNACDLVNMTWPTANAAELIVGPAFWVSIAPHHLLTQVEDDVSWYDVDTTSCATTSSYSHQPDHAEAGNGDDPEPMACDPLSFQTVPSTGVPLPGAVVWLAVADPATSTPIINGYTVPTATCRLETDLRLTLASNPVDRGAANTVCATLAHHARAIPLPGRRLDFHLPGGVQSVSTDPNGSQCVPFAAPASGGDYTLKVGFAGDRAFEPAAMALQLHVPLPAGVAPPPYVPPTSPPAPPPKGPAAAAPAPASGGAPAGKAPASGAQPEAPAQATQVQQQPVSQVQPGMAAEREHARQLATATDAQSATQQQELDVVPMAALTEPGPAPSPALIAGALTALATAAAVAMGWVSRAPSLAHSRRRPRRR